MIKFANNIVPRCSWMLLSLLAKHNLPFSFFPSQNFLNYSKCQALYLP